MQAPTLSKILALLVRQVTVVVTDDDLDTSSHIRVFGGLTLVIFATVTGVLVLSDKNDDGEEGPEDEEGDGADTIQKQRLPSAAPPSTDHHASDRWLTILPAAI